MPHRAQGDVARADERHASVLALQEDVRGFLNVGLHFPSRVFPPGAVIVREGEPGDEAFIITTGNCMVVKRSGESSRLVGRLGPGDVFGETAILTRTARTADGGRDRRRDRQDRDAAADRGPPGRQHLARAVRAGARRSLPRGRREARRAK